MINKLYTVKEVLELVGISRNTLYNWEKAGKIPVAHRNVSGHRVYTEEELQRIREYARTLYMPAQDVKRGK